MADTAEPRGHADGRYAAPRARAPLRVSPSPCLPRHAHITCAVGCRRDAGSRLHPPIPRIHLTAGHVPWPPRPPQFPRHGSVLFLAPRLCALAGSGPVYYYYCWLPTPRSRQPGSWWGFHTPVDLSFGPCWGLVFNRLFQEIQFYGQEEHKARILSRIQAPRLARIQILASPMMETRAKSHLWLQIPVCGSVGSRVSVQLMGETRAPAKPGAGAPAAAAAPGH